MIDSDYMRQPLEAFLAEAGAERIRQIPESSTTRARAFSVRSRLDPATDGAARELLGLPSLDG